jgi:hypothetical protein
MRLVRSLELLLPAMVISTAILISGGRASASTWTSALSPGSTFETQAQAGPAAPAGPSAACVSLILQPEVTVTWSGVTHASSYTVFVSSGSGYSAVATGVTGTSWTSAPLATGTYTFELDAYVGTHWVSANSAATGSHTVSILGTCV